MYLGIDNAFVLVNIFGNTDFFRGAEIVNINWQLIDARMEISIQTQCKVLNPPPKWKRWDGVCLRLEIFGVEELVMNIDKNKLYIDTYYMREENKKNIIIFDISNNRSIKCRFEIARVQNIRPIVLEGC